MERTIDKETLVRIHAVIALCKLAGSEDPDEIQTGKLTTVDVAMGCMRSDPAASVFHLSIIDDSPTVVSVRSAEQL